MKQLITSIIAMLFIPALTICAQDATYHLPKTAVKLTIKVEKTAYTPGELCAYAQRFLKKNDVRQEPLTTYSIIDAETSLLAVPDSSKVYTAHIDQKHNIQKLAINEDNILLAINADAKKTTAPKPFVPARKPAALDPYKFLSQDILSAGSKMKMSQMCAQEIYDIRESKSELTRGQADYMPKDGEQLRIMLNSLDTQEAAIRQLFEGVTVTDTTEVSFVYVPSPEEKSATLFRFSKYYGVVDTDDLSGEPYTIEIEDLHTMPEHIAPVGKKQKDETGLWINLPGKVRATISTLSGPWKSLEFSAGQFGEVENLNEPLFSKKVNTSLVLNPFNGGIEKIDSTPVK